METIPTIKATELRFVNAPIFGYTVRQIFRNQFKMPVHVMFFHLIEYPNSTVRIYCENGIPDELNKVIQKQPDFIKVGKKAVMMEAKNWIQVFEKFL